MGNQVVYEDGKFITPIKVQRTLTLDKSKIDYENVFGKVQIPSARAEAGDKDFENQINSVDFSHVQYYKKTEQSEQILPKRMIKSEKILQQIDNDQNNYRHAISRKAQSQVKQSQILEKPILKIYQAKQSIIQYESRKNSPVKDQNKTPQQSNIQIFQSRLQSQYFKLIQ